MGWQRVYDDDIYWELPNRFLSKKMTVQDMKMLENSYTSYLEKYILDHKNKEKILGGKFMVII